MELGTPRGFRDTMLDEAEMREQICSAIGAYFSSQNYRLIHTPVAERLDCMAAGSGDQGATSPLLENAFRFVDVDGELLSLRVDVTLPIARVAATRFKNIPGPYRLRYCTEVFREQESLRGQPRAITQIGIEFLDADGVAADTEVVKLALGALATAGLEDFSLNIGNVAIFMGCIESLDGSYLGADPSLWRRDVVAAAHKGDFVAVRELVAASDIPKNVRACLTALPFIRGGAEALAECRTLLDAAGVTGQAIEALDTLGKIYVALEQSGYGAFVTVDFSLMLDMGYYTGLVFEVYTRTFGLPLGSGGRYDNVVGLLGRAMPAAGFAFDLGRLENALRLSEDEGANNSHRTGNHLRIAVPKGALFEGSLDLLEQAGLDVTGLRDPKRQLRILTDEIEYIIAKPTDVAIYVANGAVDCGIGGKDILVEADYPLLEFVDLKFGGCKFVVAQPAYDTQTLGERALRQGCVRVATKYPRLTSRYFDSLGIQAEIVKLNGNIELAPLIGISDVIVDITATGTTLRENNLVAIQDVTPSTARFVANPASARTDKRVSNLAKILYDLVEEGR